MSCCSNFFSVAVGWCGADRGPRVLRQLSHMRLHRSTAEARLRPEGPGEGAAPQCLLEAVERGVQVRPPARQPPSRIGDDLAVGAPVVEDDAQQVCLGRSLPATHAGADGLVRTL
jgi:hypothetical protein